MPRVGEKLAPAPSDIDEVMTLGAPQDVETPFDESMEAGFAGGFDKWTSTEARRAKANRVTHTSVPRITLYDYMGNDRTVDHADLVSLTDPSLPAKNRLYVRCPQCVKLPNNGLHEFSGPNTCPGRPAQKFMVCPICASRGINKKVYETVAIDVVDADVSDDPNYIAAPLPGAAGREDRLKEQLGQHMTAFHGAEAEQMYGVRREVNGNGFRVIWSRD